MSLEIALQENTATLKELISALQSMGKLEIIPVTASKKPAPAKAEAPVDTPPAATTAPTTKSQAPAVPETVAESLSEAAPLNYDKDVKPLILKLAGDNRQAVVEVLGRFGVTTAKDLLPEHYAQVIQDVKRVLAGGAA